MRAYIVLEIEVVDPVKYDKYRQISGASIEQYGGRFIVRGGKLEVLEGDWAPKRLVVLEFPSADQAKAWFNSPEYAPAKAIRKEAARAKVIVVDGV